MNYFIMIMTLIINVACNAKNFDTNMKGLLLNVYIDNNYSKSKHVISDKDALCLELFGDVVDFDVIEERPKANREIMIVGDMKIKDTNLFDETLRRSWDSQKKEGKLSSSCPTDYISAEINKLKKLETTGPKRARKDRFRIKFKLMENGQKVVESIYLDSIKKKRRATRSNFSINLNAFWGLV